MISVWQVHKAKQLIGRADTETGKMRAAPELAKCSERVRTRLLADLEKLLESAEPGLLSAWAWALGEMGDTRACGMLSGSSEKQSPIGQKRNEVDDVRSTKLVTQ